jgi:hypothetical protein
MRQGGPPRCSTRGLTPAKVLAFPTRYELLSGDLLKKIVLRAGEVRLAVASEASSRRSETLPMCPHQNRASTARACAATRSSARLPVESATLYGQVPRT